MDSPDIVEVILDSTSTTVEVLVPGIQGPAGENALNELIDVENETRIGRFELNDNDLNFITQQGSDPEITRRIIDTAGLGAGVAAALAIAVGNVGGPVVKNGDIGAASAEVVQYIGISTPTAPSSGVQTYSGVSANLFFQSQFSNCFLQMGGGGTTLGTASQMTVGGSGGVVIAKNPLADNTRLFLKVVDASNLSLRTLGDSADAHLTVGNIRSTSQNWVSYGGAGADTTFDGNNLTANYATFTLKNTWGGISLESQTALTLKASTVTHLVCSGGTSAFTGNVTASGTIDARTTTTGHRLGHLGHADSITLGWPGSSYGGFQCGQNGGFTWLGGALGLWWQSAGVAQLSASSTVAGSGGSLACASVRLPFDAWSVKAGGVDKIWFGSDNTTYHKAYTHTFRNHLDQTQCLIDVTGCIRPNQVLVSGVGGVSSGDRYTIYHTDTTYSRSVGFFHSENGAEGGLKSTSQLQMKPGGSFSIYPTGQTTISATMSVVSSEFVWTTYNSPLIYLPSAASNVPMRTRGLSGQTGNLFECQTNTPTTVFSVGPTGTVNARNYTLTNPNNGETAEFGFLSGSTYLQVPKIWIGSGSANQIKTLGNNIEIYSGNTGYGTVLNGSGGAKVGINNTGNPSGWLDVRDSAYVQKLLVTDTATVVTGSLIGTGGGLLTVGAAANRLANVYSVLGDFSGAISCVGLTSTSNATLPGIVASTATFQITRANSSAAIELVGSPAVLRVDSGVTISGGPFTSVFQSLSANPTTLDLAAGQTRTVKNTTSGVLSLFANDGGVIKKVDLT